MDITNLKNNNNSDVTIAVAMSGGVDSSVSAALLKEQGYNVLGFFMKNWGDTCGLKSSDCPWKQDRQDAMRVASKLDIPFHTLDFEEEYQKEVLDYFFDEYKNGRTPNPDILCNSKIKFGVFLREAINLGADYIATGHYARKNFAQNRHSELVSESLYNKKKILKQVQDDKKFQLLKGLDSNKDQSYFLYRLNQKQLSRTIFPIGEFTKPDVRKMAKKFGLQNHDKHDSQGVCFIGKMDLKKFLSQKIKDNPGDIVDSSGKKIGSHTGLFWYTIGQRRGIEIGGTGPYYVVKKDFKSNKLIVTNDSKDKGLFSEEVEIRDVNWISGITPSSFAKATADMSNSPLARGEVLECRIRYREPLTKCEIIKQENNTYHIKFEKAQFAVCAGQSVVFYEKQVCLGGGIINGSAG